MACAAHGANVCDSCDLGFQLSTNGVAAPTVLCALKECQCQDGVGKTGRDCPAMR